MTELAIDEIRIVDRHRQDLGDIPKLADSISESGLLHPIVVSPDFQLIAGQRRLEACRRLGWARVPVTVATNLTTTSALLVAERDENTCRMDMLPSEKASLGMALEELERPAAAERKRDAGVNNLPTVSEENFSSLTDDDRKGQTRDLVGASVGMSGPTFQRAKAVVNAAAGIAADGATLPESVQEVAKAALADMDRTGKVTPSYNKIVKAKAAAAAIADELTSTNVDGPIKAAGRDHSRKAVEMRVTRAKEMAAQGYTSRQIAHEIGVTASYLSEFRRKHDIEVPADATAAHINRGFDSYRIVNETVRSITNIGSLFQHINYTELDPNDVSGWVAILNESIGSLNTLRKHLNNRIKESTQP